MPFIPTTDENRKAMLEAIGVSTFEELLAGIPKDVRLEGELELPPPLSEFEVEKHLRELAAMNAHSGTHACFLGGGAYDHFIPAAVGHIVSRSEFYTAYTPYQPEVAQGNLQAMYEFQTMVCELTGMDVSNASVYDGATALAEAALLCQAQTGRTDVLVSRSVHPFHRRVVATYCGRIGIQYREISIRDGVTDLDALRDASGPRTAGVLVQHPNFFGLLEPVAELAGAAHAAGGLFTVSADPVSLGLLEPPGAYGADVAVGEGQALGNPLNFGGPYLGLFAVKKDLVRRLPGRLAAATEDAEGRRGFVLTLQTREQHIRREKAASSICTNQQLCALAATVYLALMGRRGLPAVAELCLQKAHYLADRLTAVPGFSLMFPGPFFKEFVLRTPVPPAEVIRVLFNEGLFAGIDLSRFDYGMEKSLLVAVTEKRTREEMDRYALALAKHFAVRRPAPGRKTETAVTRGAGKNREKLAGKNREKLAGKNREKPAGKNREKPAGKNREKPAGEKRGVAVLKESPVFDARKKVKSASGQAAKPGPGAKSGPFGRKSKTGPKAKTGGGKTKRGR